MPNWCFNKLIIKHEDEDRLQQVAAAYYDQTLLNYFKPFPEESNEDEYNWCLDNWGTKWDIQSIEPIEDYGDKLILQFNTAWCPPIFALETAEELGFEIELSFFDEGCEFIGTYKNGIYIEQV